MPKTIKVILSVIILVFLIFSIFFSKEETIDNNTKEKTTNNVKEELIEDYSPQKEEDISSGNSFFELKEQEIIHLVSEVDTLGETIEVIKNQGNVSFVRGKYGNTLSFYRLYLIDNEGANIYFETSEENPEFKTITTLMEEAKYEEIFNIESNQESFLLKTPYEVGNEWGYGKIISVKDQIITVEYENGDKIFFEKGIGITEIHYNMPDDMKNHFTEEQFKARKIDG